MYTENYRYIPANEVVEMTPTQKEVEIEGCQTVQERGAVGMRMRRTS